jgi:hypothetical protein
MHRCEESVLIWWTRSSTPTLFIVDPMRSSPLRPERCEGPSCLQMRASWNPCSELTSQVDYVFYPWQEKRFDCRCIEHANNGCDPGSCACPQSVWTSGELRLASHGHAHSACSFDGMRLVSAEDLDEVVAKARSRKKLGNKIPTVEAFVDKL